MKAKLYLCIVAILASLAVLIACEPERIVVESGPAGFEGYHVGYSWSGEARGTAFEDAGSYIETVLRLDEDATILSARMRYWQRADGFWTTRQSGNARVSVDFSVEPTAATLGSEYQPGDSMFSIYTMNLMSFYAVAVHQNGTAAVTIVEPVTRYQFEMKFPPGFDYRAQMNELTIGSGIVVPTVRTSGGGFSVPASWDELSDRHLFGLHIYSHVLTDRGVFAGIGANSTVRNLMQAMGVEFDGDRPVATAPKYGYTGIGGWKGNYDAIAEYLVGRNARTVTSLVDWAPARYRNAINDQNFFGVDVPTGATRTVQDSVDGISGATVRMSRESASYQRALVDAGILSESDVIKGRF